MSQVKSKFSNCGLLWITKQNSGKEHFKANKNFNEIAELNDKYIFAINNHI